MLWAGLAMVATAAVATAIRVRPWPVRSRR